MPIDSSHAEVAETALVSVIVPTYNRAHVLPRTLQSVLAQTYPYFELLVIDDGSTDDTPRVMQPFLARDPRVRYRMQPNGGVSAARNHGLREARGAYIAFLDSDDEWLPRKLEKQIGLFEKLPAHVGLVYTGLESVFATGRSVAEEPVHRGDVYAELLERNVIHGGGSNVVLRREAAEAAGFFDEVLPAIEDWDYWIRVTKHYHVDFVPEPLARYHDAHTETDRRSLHFGKNMEARACLFERYLSDLRQHGKAHLFLLESARRLITSAESPGFAAWPLILRAVYLKPLSHQPYVMLGRSLVPDGLFRTLRRMAGRTAVSG